MNKKFFLILLTTVAVLFNSLELFGEPQKIGAQGAVLIDYDTGRLLWGKNENMPLAMASTTKIMTAVLALENADMNDMAEVSSNAAAAPPVKMKLQTGEKIKLEYLMYALMMQSSNDAAVAIAEHVGGSVENFCAMMTNKAKEIGCTDTLFETPNGLDKGDHHSTAYDMALIARYALKNEKFREIIATPEITFKSSKATYYVTNKNRLLREYEGAIGVKTGFTGKAGHCFVGAAQRGDVTLVSVVLASGWGNTGKEKKWKDTKEILDYGFSNYKYYSILSKGDTAGSFAVEKGKKDKCKCIFESDFKALLTEEEYGNIRLEKRITPFSKAPVEKGAVVGNAIIYCGNEKIGDINLIAEDAVAKKDFSDTINYIFVKWLNIFCK